MEHTAEKKTPIRRLKKIRLITTGLTGREVNDILADFVFKEKGTRVVKCPAGYEPRLCSYTGDKSQQFHVSFQRSQCANCPYRTRCKARIHKRVSTVTIIVKARECVKYMHFMETQFFNELLRLHNGVETLPSMHQNHTDRMAVRGLVPSGSFFAGKIDTINFMKLFTFLKGTGVHFVVRSTFTSLYIKTTISKGV